ncbi:tail fiber domain-containing protein [Flammeovirga sp. OC4]|uniref:tail fiber domain-containing protein n=1 Tax=Flammeovirga sp. OC4 TaxID=1382345 RepID=UPI0005C60CA8|nr:tail fiber domain-containing protein [Flammeovirga sp. OC4]
MKTLFLFAVAMFAALMLHAQKIPFQGKLSENGTPVNGTKTISFSIGNWNETHQDVQIVDGFYAVVLGSITPIEGDIYNLQGETTLFVEVDGTKLDPISLYAPVVNKNMKELAIQHPNDSVGTLITSTSTRIYSMDGIRNVSIASDRFKNGSIALYDSTGASKAWLTSYSQHQKTGGLLSLYGNGGAWVGTGFKTWDDDDLPYFHLEGYKVEHKPLVNLQLNSLHDQSDQMIGEAASFRLQTSEDSQAAIDFHFNTDPNGGPSSVMEIWGHSSPNITMKGQEWTNSNRPMIHIYGETPDDGDWFKSMLDISVEYDDHLESEYGAISFYNGISDKQHTHINASSFNHEADNGSGVTIYEKDWDGHLPMVALNPTKESNANGSLVNVQISKLHDNGMEYGDIWMKHANDSIYASYTSGWMSISDDIKGAASDMTSDNISINKYGNVSSRISFDVPEWNNYLPTMQMSKDDENLFEAIVIEETESTHASIFVRNVGSTKEVGIDPNSFRISRADLGDLVSISTAHDNQFGEYGEIVLRDTLGGELVLNRFTDFSAISSDLRYKSNINPLQNSLEKVMQLKGVSYFYKTDEFPKKSFDRDQQVGLIAQEVEEVFPELVKTDQEGYKSVHYAQTVAVLIEAIKELNQKIELLSEENKSLKASLNTAQENAEQIKVLQAQMLQLLSEVQSK